MKKIAIILSAALAALSLVSCNKEELNENINAAPEEGIAVNIRIAGINGDADTKSVKSAWENGDKINIWLDQVSDYGANPDIVLTYDGSAWSASSLKSTPNSSGTIYALYEGYNDWSGSYEHSANTQKLTKTLQGQFNSGASIAFAMPLMVYNAGSSYSYDGTSLTADISSWSFMNNVQVVIAGLDPAKALNYTLRVSGFSSTGQLSIDSANANPFSRAGYAASAPVTGVPNEDGVAFYFNCGNKSGSRAFTFTLLDTETGSNRRYTVTKNLTTSADKLTGIKIDKLNFQALSGKFSVSDTKKVKFSSGNLQMTFNGGNKEFGIAMNQYDHQGSTLANRRKSTNNGEIVDLFYWSMSDDYGYSYYAAYRPFVDWGQAIGDGNTWRTLTSSEWAFLILHRTLNGGEGKGYSYEETTITMPDGNSIKGVVVPPDDYTAALAASYTWDEWLKAEEAGFVFLVAAGYSYYSRGMTIEAQKVGEYACYWTSSSYDNYPCNVNLLTTPFGGTNTLDYCYTVRLVTDVN